MSKIMIFNKKEAIERVDKYNELSQDHGYNELFWKEKNSTKTLYVIKCKDSDGDVSILSSHNTTNKEVEFWDVI